jgi:hypothetical protein
MQSVSAYSLLYPVEDALENPSEEEHLELWFVEARRACPELAEGADR